MTSRSVRLAGRVAAAAIPTALLSLSACNLDVKTPDVVAPSATAGAGALPTLLAGAVGDFSVGFSGEGGNLAFEGLALESGLFADEFIATDYFDTHFQIDARQLIPANGSNTGVLRNVQRAVVSAENTAARYEQFAPKDPGLARSLDLAGYGYLLVAENFCGGVPFSRQTASGATIYGAPLTTEAMLNAAIARFDSASTAAAAAGDSREANLALVGIARAQLDLGQFAQAGATAAKVDPGFQYLVEHGTSDDRVKSGIYEMTNVTTRFTVADGEGGNGLPFVSSGDPRTATNPLGKSAFDAGTPLFAPAKYPNYSAPEVLADYTEAQLIVAEAQLHAGNYAGAGGTLEILNQLRAAAGLTPLAPAAGAAAQVDQLFAERAYFMFGTAHRLGDLRRLIRQYGRSAEAVFPTGAYFKGGKYGNQVNLLVPQEEQNNPSFNRSACDPTKA